jgi:hypothetical protein
MGAACIGGRAIGMDICTEIGAVAGAADDWIPAMTGTWVGISSWRAGGTGGR